MRKSNVVMCVVAVFTALLILWPSIMTVRGTGGWTTSGVQLFVPILAVFVIWVLRSIVRLSHFLEGRERSKKNNTSSRITQGLLIGWVLGIAFSGEIRMYGFELAAERAEPLIGAIERYIGDNGKPPESLNMLVPDYLAEIPEKLPPIELVTDPERLPAYGDNLWALTAMVSKNLMNWDMFIYFPDQDYPETGYGGVFERLGAWAYVHE